MICICICIVFVMCSERERGEYLLEEEGKIYAGTHSKPRGRCQKTFNEKESRLIVNFQALGLRAIFSDGAARSLPSSSHNSLSETLRASKPCESKVKKTLVTFSQTDLFKHQVARAISAMVNSNDGDLGVLVGRCCAKFDQKTKSWNVPRYLTPTV